MEQYIEILLLSLLLALLYKTPKILNDFAENNSILYKTIGIICIILLEQKFGMNSAILGVAIFFTISYQKKILENLDLPDIEESQNITEGLENIGVSNIGQKSDNKNDRFMAGNVSRRNIVDLDRRLKKHAERKKNAAVFQINKEPKEPKEPKIPNATQM
jgi:hypothetical protein